MEQRGVIVLLGTPQLGIDERSARVGRLPSFLREFVRSKIEVGPANFGGTFPNEGHEKIYGLAQLSFAGSWDSILTEVNHERRAMWHHISTLIQNINDK